MDCSFGRSSLFFHLVRHGFGWSYERVERTLWSRKHIVPGVQESLSWRTGTAFPRWEGATTVFNECLVLWLFSKNHAPSLILHACWKCLILKSEGFQTRIRRQAHLTNALYRRHLNASRFRLVNSWWTGRGTLTKQALSPATTGPPIILPCVHNFPLSSTTIASGEDSW